jgi:hypothetical protein
MATCNCLSSNDLRVANPRVPSVYLQVEVQHMLLGENMCEIGKPLEIIDVEPVSLPAPLQRTKNERERHQKCSPLGGDRCRS